MENRKRVRRANFTAEERKIFAELVTKYKHIIDDKRTGGIYYNKKKEAWRVITKKYNSNCTTGPREPDHLKALYDNMKQKSRKLVAENNVQMNKTGGGEQDSKPKSNQVEPLPNPYDSAAAYFKEMDVLCESSSSASEDEHNMSNSPRIESKSTYSLQNDGVLKKIEEDDSAEALKRLYFRKKIQNAELEHKKLALQILFMEEEHKLKMEIYKNKK